MTPPSDRFRTIAQIIRRHDPEGSMGKGASLDVIEKCERQLSVQLPESYKWFLGEFSYGNWPDYIHGLAPGLGPGDHLVRIVQDERREGQPRLPHHLIPFSGDGWGNLYCLNTAELTNGECPVVLWHHEDDENQVPEVLQPTFLDWLDDKIQRKLEREARKP
jgi:hypothetical protein